MSAFGRLADAPAEGRERRWFTAGERRLAIDAPARGPSTAVASGTTSDTDGAATVAAFHDAVLLEAHATLLDCLADCLDETLDWRPLDAGDVDDAPLALTLASGDARRPDDDVVDAVAADEGPAGPRLALSGTLPDVCELRARHAPWRGRVALHPHRLSTELVLDRLTLDTDDLARCTEGCVVLLPASFGDGWTVSLRTDEAITGDESTAPSGLARPNGPSEPNEAPGSDGTSESDEATEVPRRGPVPCDVVLEERFVVAADAFDKARGASPFASMPSNASVALDDATLARTSHAAHAARHALERRRCRLLRSDGGVARGELVRLGSGCGVVVDGFDRWT